MRKKLGARLILTLLIPIYFLGGCNSLRENTNSEKGKLAIVANGEDLIREGFVSKEGWRIDFNKVYVTLDKITAYQTDPPFNAQTDEQMKVSEKVVVLDNAKTVDLAAGDRILIRSVEAPPGRYNGLTWQIAVAETGPAAGNTMLLEGTAQKEDRNINFSIGVNKPVQYACGEFVGDDRKGILNAGGKADLETTFHFDHLFGDAVSAPDDAMNIDALGFDPLANLAENSAIDLDMTTLEKRLSPEEYQRLKQALTSLGHVGEGHCAKKGE